MRNLVLWGHDAQQCQDLFALTAEQMNTRILEYGCGPSAVGFTQEPGGTIISCDPLFVLDKATLRSKVSLIFADMAEEIKKEGDLFDFSSVGGLDALLSMRQKGLTQFFDDYEAGIKEGRYVGVSEYSLPFADFSFDFALSAHYLFADLEEQSVELHLMVIRELARVAKEVRIVPLIDRAGVPSELLGPVLLGLQKENYGIEIKDWTPRFYRQSNAMLRIWAQQCTL